MVTADSWIMTFCSTSLCYNIEGKSQFQGHGLCTVSAFSSCVHGFSLSTTVSSHIPKTCMLDASACPSCPSLSECERGCECSPRCKDILSVVGSQVVPWSCWDWLQPHATLNRINWVGKYLFMSIRFVVHRFS